jgi:hypothetical protein
MKANMTKPLDERYLSEDDTVIGTAKAETRGDEIILDKFVDDNGEGSARMLTLTMLASLGVLASIAIAAIIKILQ